MGDSRLKPGFGDKENIESAKEKGDLDSYDVIFLTDGEIAWIDKDGNTIMNTPRTQNEIVFANGVTIEAGKTMDEMAKILGKFESSGGNPFVELGGKYADKLPTFAAGIYDQIAPAIEEGIIPYPSYVYVSDTKQLAFIDSESNIQIIKGESQVLKVDELPEIADGDENVLYIYNGIVYVFTGAEYKPMYSDITSEVLSEMAKLESKVDALEEAVKNVMDASSGLVFDEYENFPTVGVENQLYIDLDGDMIYRYDEEENQYIKLGQQEEIITSYNDLTDKPIINITGAPESAVDISKLDDGVYNISDYYYAPDDELYVGNTLVLISTTDENKYITQYIQGNITLYIINLDSGEIIIDNYMHKIDDVPTEGSQNAITSDGVYQAIIGAMKERH